MTDEQWDAIIGAGGTIVEFDSEAEARDAFDTISDDAATADQARKCGACSA